MQIAIPLGGAGSVKHAKYIACPANKVRNMGAMLAFSGLGAMNSLLALSWHKSHLDALARPN